MTTTLKKQKLYCFVDETGQDTQGEFFLVAVVIDEQPDDLRSALEQIEEASKKGLRKWFHAGKERRRAYIQQVIESGLFAERIFYSHYSQTKEYTRLTIATTANAILEIAEEEYEATVIIDGLNKTERVTVAAGLRKQHIHVRKVRGVADESDALIRLADAMAGFIRDCLEEDADLLPLYERAMRQKIIRELK